MTGQKRIIYAIIDTLVQDIMGQTITARAEQEAVRFFADLTNTPGTVVHSHPHDHTLIKLGEIVHTDEKGWHIIPDTKTIISAANIVAARTEEQAK